MNSSANSIQSLVNKMSMSAASFSPEITTSDSTTFIHAVGVTKTFGKVVAVQGISLHANRGEIIGLVGPDGAGKTTTLRLICGALKLDAGTILVGGYDIQQQTEQARGLLGYLPQRFSLYEELTVMENIRFFA
ncbi:MAG: ATP-binding cassette domain-containing protein, partial [Desulfitobacteriaceae bacterium]|nr:ATP-binding cassette domain-containing protein [Desulfitobacteriaceae bacterium]